jgi:hypothetical protein
MTDATPPTSTVPPAVASINDNLQTSSPSLKATLIGLACIVAFIALVTAVTIYYQG